MPELQRLRADHGPAVLAFELANRAYFAAFISDRGDEFFDQFTDRYNALLAEQEAGISAFYVLVAEDGSVLGRFNLVDIEDHTAEVRSLPDGWCSALVARSPWVRARTRLSMPLCTRSTCSSRRPAWAGQ